jgi:CRP/FNR family transcriptional regulator, cyclic AMP receptor protein
MEFHSIELVGYAAAAASLYAAHSKTIIPLRVAAIVANVLVISYALGRGTYPSLLLNAILLPINTIRLRSMFNLIRDVDAATRGDLNVKWLLDYMKPVAFKAGDTFIRQGDIAKDAYYIVSGEVEVVEIEKTVGSGTLLGEMGLFTEDGRRTMSVRCKTEVHAATITYDRFKELYFQNPQFGFYLLRLIVTRMHSNEMKFASALPGK